MIPLISVGVFLFIILPILLAFLWLRYGRERTEAYNSSPTPSSSTNVSTSSSSSSSASSRVSVGNPVTGVTYPEIFNTVHEQMSGGNLVINGDTVKEMIDAGLPNVVGYTRCPEEVSSSGPWVIPIGHQSETVPGQNDLGELAVACNADPECFGFNAFLADGYLHKYRNHEDEYLAPATQRWVPTYLKLSEFNSCQAGSKIGHS